MVKDRKFVADLTLLLLPPLLGAVGDGREEGERRPLVGSGAAAAAI